MCGGGSWHKISFYQFLSYICWAKNYKTSSGKCTPTLFVGIEEVKRSKESEKFGQNSERVSRVITKTFIICFRPLKRRVEEEKKYCSVFLGFPLMLHRTYWSNLVNLCLKR